MARLSCMFIAVGALIALGGGCDRIDAGSADQVTDRSVELLLYEGGTHIGPVTIEPGAERFDEFVAYLVEVSNDGGSRSVASFAPGTVIETDLVRVNIMRRTVAVAVRQGATDAWSQRTRPIEDRDRRVVAIVGELLLK